MHSMGCMCARTRLGVIVVIRVYVYTLGCMCTEAACVLIGVYVHSSWCMCSHGGASVLTRMYVYSLGCTYTPMNVRTAQCLWRTSNI